MKPVKFPESNAVLRKPESMTDEECSALDIFRTNDGRCISCWELTGEELMEVLKTKRVWVEVHSGATQPPIYIGTSNPFKPDIEAEGRVP